MGPPPADTADATWRTLAAPFPRRSLVWCAVLLVVNAVAAAGGAWQLGVLVDDARWAAVGALAAWWAVRTVTWLVLRTTWARHVERAAVTWRTLLLGRALHQSVHQLAESSAGELVDRIDDDTDKLAQTLARQASGVASAALTALAAAAVATAENPWALVGFAGTGTLAALACWRLTPAAADSQEDLEAAWTDVTVTVEEAVAARDDLRSTGGRAHALARFSAAVRRLLAVEHTAARHTNRLWLTVNAGLTSVVLVTSIGAAAAVATGHLAVSAAVALAALAATFAQQVSQAVNNYPALIEGAAAARRVLDLARTPPEDTGDPAGDLVLDGGSVEFADVTFTYPHGTSPSCRGVSLYLPPGHSLGLVGRTGAGKSTLVALLTRQVDTPRGCVFLGGVDVCDIPLPALRSMVQVVSQRTELVAGSLHDNVSLFGATSRERVSMAFGELGLSDWVDSLPDGLDTPIGPGGLELSSGEAQLVAFARLLVRDPLVVVLDEATARMDPLTEARVARAASRLLHMRTGILVAHRLGTLRACDDLAVLDHGTVTQTGPRHHLALDPGPFADLVAASGLDPHWVAADAEDAPLPPATTRRTGDGPTTDAELSAPVLDEHWRARPWRAIWRMYLTDPANGLTSIGLHVGAVLLRSTGVAAAAAWGATVARLEAGTSPAPSLAVYLTVCLAGLAATAVGRRRYPVWWARVSCHLRASILAGQLAHRRVRPRTSGEVVARTLTSDRVVSFADTVSDLATAVAMGVVPAALLIDPASGAVCGAVLALPFLFAWSLRRRTHRLAVAVADARAHSSVLLASVVDAARTVKLFGATGDVIERYREADLARCRAALADVTHRTLLDNSAAAALAVGTVAVWALRAADVLSTPAAVAGSAAVLTLTYSSWLAQGVVASAAAARAWLDRAAPLAQTEDLVSLPDGVDFDHPPAPPAPSPAVPLECLDVDDLTVVHDDGLVGVGGCSFHVARGEIVLVIGEVASGKSSLLTALAGLRSFTGTLDWNGQPVHDPEAFLRPGQVAYVAQQPRVLSGSFTDNVTLGHDLDGDGALQVASMAPDVERAGGPDALVGHRGVRLSGGQVQRLALARALAADTELVIADDVSSALDATTEVEIWTSLRDHGCAVVAASCKLAAVRLADRVVVLEDGRQVACGPWSALADTYGRLVS